MEIKYSFPALTEASMVKLEAIMKEKFGYGPLPDDYKNFLLKNNGGYVSPGYIDDTDNVYHSEEIVFDTPLKWALINNDPVTPCIVLFFGVFFKDEMNKDDVQKKELYELVASNYHSKIEFDVLPPDMISIANCSHPDADDMLCISLAKDDYGAVYYYYGMHYYPANYHGSYYEDKKKSILNYYELESVNDIDINSSLADEILNALERVPFVKLADSFGEFSKNCRREKVEE